MSAILEWLSGKKTYVVSVCGLLIVGGWMAGLLDDRTAEMALTALGFGGAITLRAAIAKGA